MIAAVALQPVAAALAAVLLLGEKPPLAVLAAMPLSLVGIVLMVGTGYQPLRAEPFRADALLAAAVSPICIGSAAAVVRMLSATRFSGPASPGALPGVEHRPENPQVVTLYLQLFAGAPALLACALAPSALLASDEAVPTIVSDGGLADWAATGPSSRMPLLVLMLVLCGLSGYAYQLCVTLALAHARAAGAVTMESLRVCFTALADWLLFGIAMSEVNILGAALVVLATGGIVLFR